MDSASVTDAPGPPVDPDAVLGDQGREFLELAIRIDALLTLAVAISVVAAGTALSDVANVVRDFKQAMIAGNRDDSVGPCYETAAAAARADPYRAVAVYRAAKAEGLHVGDMCMVIQLIRACTGDCCADGASGHAKEEVPVLELAIEEEASVDAMVSLAFILEHGKGGVEKNVGRAVALLERAIEENGCVLALRNLAILLSSGPDELEQDVPRAVSLYIRAIREGGDAFSGTNLAALLQTGKQGLPRDAARAMSLYEITAEAGDLKAVRSLAQLLRTGDEGVRKDIPRCIRLLQRALEEDHDRCDVLGLAHLLLSWDVGEFRDPARARALLEEAVAKAPSGPVLHELAVLLSRGDVGVERDSERARELQELAEKQWDDGMRSVVHDGTAEFALDAAQVQPKQCFVLTLGGAGRGKTSVVRSLRGVPFVVEHIPTELAALNRVRVMPGARHLSAQELEELAFNSDSLVANMSRAGRFEVRRASDVLESLTQTPDALLGGLLQTRDTSTHRLSGSVREDRNAVDEYILANMTPSVYERISDEVQSVLGPDGVLQETAWGVRTGPRPEYSDVIETVRLAISDQVFPSGDRGALVQFWDLGGQTEYVMAHSLFAGFASLLIFVLDLARLSNDTTRDEEMRELCRWMQLAHSLCDEPSSTRPIIVGTRKGECVDVDMAWKLLQDGFQHELGDAAYDSWVRTDMEKTGDYHELQFVAIENSLALEDPSGSGLQALERVLKGMAEALVFARDLIPARWVAFVEYLEKIKAVFLTKEDVVRIADGFPAFANGEWARVRDALQALRYFRKLGRLVLFEVSDSEFYVFMDPSKIMDFVRQVTGPEVLVRRRLGRKDGLLLEKGLLTHEGLALLWHGHCERVRSVMLDLLCRFDLLMRLQGAEGGDESPEELIGVPALLPNDGWKGFRWALKAGESEVHMISKFDDALPCGLPGLFIANLHRAVGGKRTKADLVRSNAAKLTLEDTSRVVVAFASQRRRVLWTIRAKEPVGIANSCVRALEIFLDGPLHKVRVRRRHVIVGDCRPDPFGCGGHGSVEFELSQDWIRSASSSTLENLQGHCLGQRCEEEPWELIDLIPSIVRRAVEDSPEGPVDMPYDVFISHAGSEKHSVAYPLRDLFLANGLTCFLDDEDLRLSTKSTAEQIHLAMRRSRAAVFILSLEFASRKWPMRELRQFLGLREAAKLEGKREPLLIPLFYDLQVSECKDSELPDREEYRDSFLRNLFFSESRQKECSTAQAMDALGKLTCFVGVRNDLGESANEYLVRAADRITKDLRMEDSRL